MVGSARSSSRPQLAIRLSFQPVHWAPSFVRVCNQLRRPPLLCHVFDGQDICTSIFLSSINGTPFLSSVLIFFSLPRFLENRFFTAGIFGIVQYVGEKKLNPQKRKTQLGLS